MRRKITALVLSFSFCLLFAASVFAEDRYILRKYAFNAYGSLSTPLTADFGSGTKNILVDKKQLSAEKTLLLVAFIMDEDIFAHQLYNSASYSVYKVNMRSQAREDVVILGLGPVNGKKVELKEIIIIGEDEFGATRAMNVQGFTPVNVLNTPLQLDKENNIVLPTQVGEKNMRIGWEQGRNTFVVKGIDLANQTSSNITEDSSVFNE